MHLRIDRHLNLRISELLHYCVEIPNAKIDRSIGSSRLSIRLMTKLAIRIIGPFHTCNGKAVGACELTYSAFRTTTISSNTRFLRNASLYGKNNSAIMPCHRRLWKCPLAHLVGVVL